MSCSTSPRTSPQHQQSRHRIRRRAALLIGCLTALSLVVAACSRIEHSDALDNSDLQTIVDDWADRHDLPALAVAVTSPTGSSTFVGSSAGAEAPDESSLFIVGSLGKTLAAATTLLLVEDEVLDLDAPIERWLPAFPRANEITLRMLLSHTAGLQDPRPSLTPGPGAIAGLAATTTPAELLSEAASWVGDEYLPASYSYSNAGYWVVGAVIESATGDPLADVMREWLLEPLHMDDTSLAWPKAVEGRIVVGELRLSGAVVIPLDRDILVGINSQLWISGGVVSSARDVATFYDALFDGLLQPASLDAMTTAPPGSGGYGLGIDTEHWTSGRTGWAHGGFVPGYSTRAGHTDDGWTVAVLTNTFNVESGGTTPSLNDLIGDVLTQIAD
jgi:D-alanyl-D-alanine carboxypeptidase